MATALELGKLYSKRMWNTKRLVIKVIGEHVDSVTGCNYYESTIVETHSDMFSVGELYTVWPDHGCFDEWILIDKKPKAGYTGMCTCSSHELFTTGCKCRLGKPCTCSAFDLYYFNCRCGSNRE